MDYLILPDYVERKGSLYLRSDHMDYGRSTLNSNWHQAREAEPKEYDVTKTAAPPERNLHRATYKRLGSGTDGFPKTTTQEQMDQIDLLDDYSEKITKMSLIDHESFNRARFTRKVEGVPERGFGAILPRHHPDYNKMHLRTTQQADFQPPYTYEPAEWKEEDPGYLTVYRKCNSQFTDTADYRRLGRNTFQDESGIYGNSQEKIQVFPKTQPILERLV